MSEFINTIDSLGDELTLGKLIDGSHTEIKDNIITKLKNYCFYNRTNLVSVDFPNVKDVASYAFQDCSNLTTANLPNVTSIGEYVFDGCSKLTSINLPNVTEIGQYAFFNCTNLASANFTNLKSIGQYAFNNCVNLTTVNLPSTISIGHNAFYGCGNLTSIDLPSVTNITSGFVFYNCVNLTTVKIPNIEILGGLIFFGCSKLTKVDFPKLTNFMGNQIFQNCKALETVILRSETMCTLSNVNSFTFTPIASGTGYIYVPRALIDTYKTATNWSTYAAQFRVLEDYTVDGTTTGEFVEKYTVRFLNGDTVLQESLVPYGEVPIYNGEEPTTTEANCTFMGWSPNVSGAIENVDYEAYFKYNDLQTRALVQGTLTSIYSETATSVVASAFYEKSTLKQIILPNVTTVNSSAFERVSNLELVNLPKVTNISNSCFYYCGNLTQIDLPSVTVIEGYAFRNCGKLKAVILRSEAMCTLSNVSTFESTPIKNGTGYIYVPRALIEDYKAATNWSTYANQFRAIEDYPTICGGDN